MRFLVADDSAVDRQLLASLLENWGYEIDQVSSFAGLLPRVASQNYVALFIDIVMPEDNGYNFVRALRKDPNIADQYIIFYSHKKTALEINYGLKKIGANDYFVKPANEERLKEILSQIPGVYFPITTSDSSTNSDNRAYSPSQVREETEQSLSMESQTKRYRGVAYGKPKAQDQVNKEKPQKTSKLKYRGVEID